MIKAARISDILKNGAVACFVPVDLNTCTTRDMIDILGLSKEIAQKIASHRPLAGFDEAKKMALLDVKSMQQALDRGAVLKTPPGHQTRMDINHATADNLSTLGLTIDMVKMIERGRPFTTWGELEEYLCPDEAQWQILRQKSCLTIIPC